jgi:hypothetical protein
MTTADGSVLGTTQVFGTAPRNRALNVVMLGDGFTAAQQGAFDNACAAFVTALRATPPYDGLSPAINVFRVNVTSTDAGADDPVAAGGTGATARTYFDATFGGNGIRRLLLCNATTALTVAAAQVPEFSVVILVVNSFVHGGSGGSVGTYSLAPGAVEIALHEIGHTAFGLADEYGYYAGGNEPGREHHPSYEPGEPNVTTNSDRNTLKWRWAVSAATTIPTMSNPNCAFVDGRLSTVPAGTVGAFEGAHYYHCGAYRPEYDCKMRNLGVSFCRICRQVIRNRIGPLLTLSARGRTPINVVSRSPDHLDVFAVASDGRIMGNWWDRISWGGWSQISGGLASPGGAGSPVTAVPRYPGHLDAFTVGTDDRVWGTWWDQGSGWWGWSPIGNLQCRAGSTANVVSRASDHLDLFTTAADGRVMATWWDPAMGWASWYHVSGGFAAPAAPVTAIARNPGHLDLFVVGTDNRVWSIWWDWLSGWAPGWYQVGDLVARSDSTITVVARSPDRLDLFTTASDGRVMSARWDTQAGWQPWFQVAGGLASPGSAVSAVARYSNHMDVFVIGVDDRVYGNSWHDPGGWAGWFQIAGGVGVSGGHVAAVSRTPERLDVFTVGIDGSVYNISWQGSSGWAPAWSQL